MLGSFLPTGISYTHYGFTWGSPQQSVISGVLAAGTAGTYSLTLYARDSAGTVVQSAFVLTVTAPPPPVEPPPVEPPPVNPPPVNPPPVEPPPVNPPPVNPPPVNPPPVNPPPVNPPPVNPPPVNPPPVNPPPVNPPPVNPPPVNPPPPPPPSPNVIGAYVVSDNSWIIGTGIGRDKAEARLAAVNDCKTAKSSRTMTNPENTEGIPTTETIPARGGGNNCSPDPSLGWSRSGYFPGNIVQDKCMAVRTGAYRTPAIPSFDIPAKDNYFSTFSDGSSELDARLSSWRSCRANLGGYKSVGEVCVLRALICIAGQSG